MTRKSGSQGLLIGYEQVMQKIDASFAERIHNVRMLFIKTAQEMQRDAKNRQSGGVWIKTKVKGRDKKTVNNNVAKAIAYAKAHSGNDTTIRGNPWINRTGRALRGITAIVDGNTEEISLKLSHSIYYGAYLEYGYNRKFAVLEPLVRQYAPKLIEEAKRIMGGGSS